MIFVFGGAYQGMEDYARSALGAKTILTLTEADETVDFSADAVAGLERFALGCVRRGVEPAAYLAGHAAEWADKILIGLDFSCGLVPMDAELRAWREANGRMNNELAGRAERVVRLFCGLPQQLK